MAIWISIGIAALGLIPLLIVLWKRQRVNKLRREGDIVTGTVLQVQTFHGYKGSVYYKAVIEYPVFNRAPMQGTYTFTGKKGLQTYYQGRRLEIYYDKNKPERFIPKDAGNNTFLLVFVIIIALVYFVLCYCLFGTMREAGL